MVETFFDPTFHERILELISRGIGLTKHTFNNGLKKQSFYSDRMNRIARGIVAVLLVIQLLFPLRFLLYNGNVFWTERGYRFAWRVMLMEKTGYANFKIVDGVTGKRFYVQNEDFLSAFQQKQMSTQQDFIVEYGQYLGQHFSSQGHENVEVYVESYASLNGRPSQQYVRPDIDLMRIDKRNLPSDLITPLNE